MTFDDVLSDLHQHFALLPSPPRHFTRRYLDTFDWRLHDAGSTLYLENTKRTTTLRWENLADETVRHARSTASPPRFAEDLPPGHFRDDLAGIISYRVLLPLAEVNQRRRVYRVLDKNEKTVVRLATVEHEATAQEQANDGGHEKPAPQTTLHVLPVKGYDEAYTALCNALATHPGTIVLDQHPLLALLPALGRTPGDTSTKGDLALDPAMRADDAVKTILRTLMATLTLNEPGVRQDLDSEFLHDFRVAIRRTRSILGQMKQVIPPDVLNHFAPEFKWLGSITGPTRDLDVYLIKYATYVSWLPASVQQDLAPLHTFLQHRQARAHQRMVEALDTDRYHALLASWQAYLDDPLPSPPPSPDALRPVLDVASRRIWKAYRRVKKQGQAIINDPHAPAALLHKLRIACKKLRYLLELFRSLYPPKTIKKLIKALKQLQDNLGDYNDFEVQQRTLHQFALQMMDEGDVPAPTFLAMGRLEARLERLQQETHEAFTEHFTRFVAKKNQRRFKRLFQL